MILQYYWAYLKSENGGRMSNQRTGGVTISLKKEMVDIEGHQVVGHLEEEALKETWH